jgi:hypothetical protein
MSDNSPRGLDCICLTDSYTVRCGLEDILTAAIGEHGYNLTYVAPELALLVIEVAKRAEDKPEWFPRGKWATVQAMQAQVERELSKLFCLAEEDAQ